MHHEDITMRIGIIGQALDNQYAGIHYFLKNLVKSLSHVNDTHDLFLLRIDDLNPYDMQNIETTTIKRRGFAGRMKFIFRDVSHWASQNQLDVVFEPAHFGPFNLPKHIKRVTFIHDLTPVLNPHWHPLISSSLQRLFLPRIISKADLVLTNSQFTKSEIMKYYRTSTEKIKVIHLGITARFKSTINKQTLGKYGIHKEYFLFLGTIEPRKNIQKLIEAYEAYREHRPNSQIQLIIAGKIGWKSRKIVKAKYESRYNDDIILLGYVDRADIPTLYSAAKAFIYPSLYEGFGLPVLEALACGTMVLTSNKTSLPEVGSNYPLYFDPKNAEDLAQCLLKVCSGKSVETDDQVVYAQKFTWHSSAQKFMEALEIL